MTIRVFRQKIDLSDLVVDMKKTKKVIIIDDDESLTTLLIPAFNAKGFEAESYNTGQSALDFLLKEGSLETIALIILDRILGDIDGMEVLKKISEKHPKHPPILILSVLSSEKDIIKGLTEGAIEYIAKPFKVPELLSKAMILIEKNK